MTSTTAIPGIYATEELPQTPRTFQRTCRIENLSMSTLFEDPSPCRFKCTLANKKCYYCKKLSTRKLSSRSCLKTHRKLLKRCETCKQNPHGLTKIEITRIKQLNNLNYNETVVKLFGETVVTIPNVQFRDPRIEIFYSFWSWLELVRARRLVPAGTVGIVGSETE